MIGLITAVIYEAAKYDQQSSSSEPSDRLFFFVNRGVFAINMTVENESAILQVAEQRQFHVPALPLDSNVSVTVTTIDGLVLWEGIVELDGSEGYVYPSLDLPQEGIRLEGKRLVCVLFFLHARFCCFVALVTYSEKGYTGLGVSLPPGTFIYGGGGANNIVQSLQLKSGCSATLHAYQNATFYVNHSYTNLEPVLQLNHYISRIDVNCS